MQTHDPELTCRGLTRIRGVITHAGSMLLLPEQERFERFQDRREGFPSTDVQLAVSTAANAIRAMFSVVRAAILR